MAPDLACVNCPICGRDDGRPFAGPAPDGSRVVRCPHDGLLYRSPRPAPARVQEFFAAYVRASNQEQFGRARRPVLQREAEAILRRKPGGSLLDVGCAAGAFFEFFPESAWRRFGVEPAAEGAARARAQYNAEIFEGRLQEAGFPVEHFDVVTILDALVYFEDPRGDLAEARRILKPDGLLAVEIPGLAYQLLRERGPLCWLLDGTWNRCFDYPWHLTFFSPRTLQRLLAEVGLRLVDAAPEQAPLRPGGVARLMNDLHFGLARMLFRASLGRLSFASRDFYLAVRA